jgi:hypothetical protein
MAATGGDLARAIEFYEMNLALSESLFGVLHGLEIAVRNSLHYVLSNDVGHADWLHDGHRLPFPTVPSLSLTGPMNKMLAGARVSAGGGAPVGKVIAELTLGFWVNMASNHFDELWRRSLYRAFPGATVRRQIIHWRLDTIRRLRNRIAHHEPILTSRDQVVTGFAGQPFMTLPEVLQCLEWISPPTALWLRATSRYERAVALLAAARASGVVL